MENQKKIISLIKYRFIVVTTLLGSVIIIQVVSPYLLKMDFFYYLIFAIYFLNLVYLLLLKLNFNSSLQLYPSNFRRCNYCNMACLHIGGNGLSILFSLYFTNNNKQFSPFSKRLMDSYICIISPFRFPCRPYVLQNYSPLQPGGD